MSRQSIIDTAKAEIGTTESPPGSNRTIYGAWYGFDGYAWCAQFVSWVYHHAGHPLGRINDDKGFRECRSAYNHWRSTGEFTVSPEKGDIVLFDWENDGRCDHTGIFVGWLDPAKTRFSSIEGNTAIGNDSDGGKVMQRPRSAATVKAFVKPRVLSGVTAPKPPAPEILKQGMKSADVAKLQADLHKLGYKITVDGVFGPETLQQLKLFQKNAQLPQTGAATPAVLGYIESQLLRPPAPAKKITTGAFLKSGNSGAAVVELQKALNKAGAIPKLKTDGIFGAATLKAVKDFQRKNHLKVDGLAGPETLHALKVKV